MNSHKCNTSETYAISIPTLGQRLLVSHCYKANVASQPDMQHKIVTNAASRLWGQKNIRKFMLIILLKVLLFSCDANFFALQLNSMKKCFKPLQWTAPRIARVEYLFVFRGCRNKNTLTYPLIPGFGIPLHCSSIPQNLHWPIDSRSRF